MNFLKPLLSPHQTQSFGNLGSSNESLAIQVTKIEAHGSVSSLSQMSVQSKTKVQPILALPIQKKRTMNYTQAAISELKSSPSLKNTEVSKSSTSFTQNFKPESTKIEVIKKSNYWQILQNCQRTNTPFTDPDFPPIDKSLGDQKYVKSQAGYTGWQRISKLVPNSVFVNTFNIQDAIQGSLKNCYFISSIASLGKDFPTMFDRIFVSNKLNEWGVYMARFYAEGVVVEVVVDDYVPVGVEKGEKKAYYARPSKESQVWAMVLEKCWAKFYRSYQRVERGRPEEAFYALTGAPFGANSLSQMPKEKKLQEFMKLYKFQQKGDLFGTFTPKFTPQDAAKGLVSLHAYSVLQIVVDPIQIIKLRNPHGINKYQINWKDYLTKQYGAQTADKYLQILREKGHDLMAPLQDGIFYMDYLEYMSKFESITVCQIKNDYNLLTTRAIFTRNKGKFFYFDLTKPSPLDVSIGQMFKKLDQSYRGQEVFYATTKIVLAKMVVRKQENGSVGYEFIGARASNESSPFNFLSFNDSVSEKIQQKKTFQPGRYVIYASINPMQGMLKKSCSVTVYSRDSSFPIEMTDLGELNPQKTSPLISVLGSIGIVDNSEKLEKKWLEQVFLDKALSERSQIQPLKNYPQKGSISEAKNQDQIEKSKTELVPLQDSWFVCRIPQLIRQQKMAGIGYVAWHLSSSHQAIETFNFEINDYYGRHIEIVTTQENFSNKENTTFTVSLRPGETKIVVLKLNYDVDNFNAIQERYPLAKGTDILSRAPIPTRVSTPLKKEKKA